MNITIEVIGTQIVWDDPEFKPLNTTDGILTGSIVSLDLTLNDVNVSNAGVYICGTMINDTLGESAMIERQYTLTVESKSLFINNIIM